MAKTESNTNTNTNSTDLNSGYCSETKIYHSLRASVPLPPIHQPLSVAEYTFSLLRHSSINAEKTSFLVNSATGQSLTFSQFIQQTQSLAQSLEKIYSLSKNDVALILAPTSLHVPVLLLSLFSIGVTISPANPISSKSELTHQLQLSKPVIAFATSKTVQKLPSLPRGSVLIDSPEFLSLLTHTSGNYFRPVDVNQSDSAAILYSSGTTGRVKAVLLTHGNLIGAVGGYCQTVADSNQGAPKPDPGWLFTLPLFHAYGLLMMLRSCTMGITLVLMERFEFETMLGAIESYRVTYMPVSPPLIVGMVKSELTKKYDLSSLQVLGSGGAPLGKDIIVKFKEKFPHIEIVQGYGLTESTAGASRMMGPDEAARHGSVGRLSEYIEAKIVDPVTGEPLPPSHRGELWIRGPTIMKGYIGDEKATAETLDSEGWLKTGDLCYFDSEGFLYIVDRLKELIKYKAYQVPPAELEHVLQAHSEIADAAVVPYPDEDAGEIPMAFVVRKPGSNITEAQVIDFVAKLVAPYKKVRRVAFVNSIPKSAAGKILRRELVNLAVSGGLAKL
ncbi:4-coumarate--CoA ligase-like 9 [Tripterygium wilfordii]|uniref:4-coumarate--CoA ligase-like 9 n=1 Tax=Tripterygium wilfordii TaxID=458696 RepID=A0A7J7CA09_TRIWF|nr:4-coumarate--CoA ligase-like 9 isoform X1 [Tripterygium wilfordii]KAF5730932.1 4-coumarate--CoA ligase-like 9 [Tripterygium wilfordii]